MSDDLEDRINRMRSVSDEFKYQTSKERKTSTAGRISHDVSKFQRFFYQLMSGLVWIFKTIIEPFIRWLYGPFLWLIGLYIFLWNRVVYIKDEYQLPVFSQIRAGIMVISTLVFAWYMFIPGVFLVSDTGLYFATAQVDENIYLNGSQQLDNEGTHAVEGCSVLPCSDSDALYFRTTNSLFNDVWSVLHRGHIFYPDQVASGIPYDISACQITSYGIRNRWLNHSGLSYPTLLGYKACRPIADSRKNKENNHE